MAITEILSFTRLLPSLITVFTVFLAYLLYKFAVLPISRMRFYRNQGITTLYFPLIGKHYRSIKDLEKHNDIAYSSKHGDKDPQKRALCSNLGSSLCITLYDTALIKEFYLHPENYQRDPSFIDIVGVLEGKGLFIVEGERWKAQRKVLSSSFNFEFLKSILGDIQKISNKIFKKQASKSLNQVDAAILFQEITADVMGSAFFGEKVNDYKTEEGKSLTLTLSEIMTDIGRLQISPLKFLLGSWIITKGVLPRFARSMKRMKDFRKACAVIIEQRRKIRETQGDKHVDLKHKDMVETLLDYQGEEGKLTTDRIVDEFITFYAGGTDTTSHLLTMCICQLIKYPEIKAKLIEEIRTKYNPNKDIKIEELNALEYVTGFVKESLRTTTPAPGIVPRTALRDHKLQDLTIKKGDLIDLNLFYLHYNSKYFVDPDTFSPERWISKTPMSDPYAFIPFSAGPRNCIGQHLAMNEAKIILCEFLSMYDFEVSAGFNPRFGSKLTYAPLDPVLLNLKPKTK